MLRRAYRCECSMLASRAIYLRRSLKDAPQRCPDAAQGKRSVVVACGSFANSQHALLWKCFSNRSWWLFSGYSSFSCLYGPGAFCKLLVRDVETVCMHVSGLQLDDSRSTPAALMRSAHPVLSKIAACLKEQPARKTGFTMLVQPISSSLFRSFANQRWWYSPLKTVCLRGGAWRNITGLAAEQRLDDSRVLVGQCDRSAIVRLARDSLKIRHISVNWLRVSSLIGRLMVVRACEQ
ncbi:hypothetical protein R69658_07809 [Paraburkholderia aspalathi]|uniref:Uncharacterized protein n=1 Tax=Paraburkholderia aspalathi TaxID=1324617 RepID=A0ABM8T7H2_9BURK|nr:hypothetical protein R69658_07809 [Paraburkholderia aspalathi]